MWHPYLYVLDTLWQNIRIYIITVAINRVKYSLDGKTTTCLNPHLNLI